jgi:hypothetical protein
MSSSFKSRNWQNAPKVSSGSASSPQESSEHEDLCPLFDTAMFLMIEREESLLGEIVQECNEVMDNAREQADEVADDIEYGL